MCFAGLCQVFCAVFPLVGFRGFLWTIIMVGVEEERNALFLPLYQIKKSGFLPFLSQAAVRVECLPQFALSYIELVG